MQRFINCLIYYAIFNKGWSLIEVVKVAQILAKYTKDEFIHYLAGLNLLTSWDLLKSAIAEDFDHYGVPCNSNLKN